MGYDLHVFRGADRSAAQPIPAVEWAEIVASSPDLRMTGTVQATTPAGETIRLDHEGLAEWTGHSDGVVVPVLFDQGRVVVKNPDDETILWLNALAHRLGGRVQGDDGKFYPEPRDKAATNRRPRGLFRRQTRPKH